MSTHDSAPTEAQAAAAYHKAQQRIVQASDKGAIVLNLMGLGLTSVPSEIGQLTQLIALNLYNNQLTSVPPEIGQLSQLITLNIYNNQLTSLPPEIGQLTQLTELNLYGNQLTSVPSEIGHLAQLTELSLYSNQLTNLPPEIGQLAQLTWLSLSKNQLTSVPPEIGQLTQLTTLYLNHNHVALLPESLRRLSQLKALFLHDNPQLSLPASVLGTPPDKWDGQDDSAPKPGPILDYYFRTRAEAGQWPLCEGKLILVGRGDVGKTSLVRRLVDNTFSRQEDTTQGIRIRQWPIKVGRKKGEIRLHVWDFGGQEITRATHQFFLTDRSLYLLVLDGRGGQQEAEADYWLRLVASFAPESPVLVILNKIKKDHFTLNRGALQQKFPQVQGFVETDCDNPAPDKQPGKNGYGIAELNAAIAQQVDQLPEIRQVFPASWFVIKEQLSQSKTEQNFLTLDEYRKLCKDHGEPNHESQMHLSLFLHRLGIALNFSDDPRLHDKHVLNPHWLTTGIYSLLTSNRLAARRGELWPEDLANELPVEKYPPAMHPFLIHLMEKFELCFSFEEPPRSGIAPQHRLLAAKYLIPELLDPQQPDAAKEFDQAKCLNFHYLYPVLPPGLLPRFIVRTHVLSEEYRWKTGVILNFEGNTALVKADAQEKTIRILINGPSRRRMLAMIRQDFDVIHRDTPHLKPDELVSFPQHPQLTVSYAKLEVLFRDDPNQSIKDVVGENIVSATVHELLEGVELAPIFAATARAASRRRDEKRLHFAQFAEAPEPLKVFYSYAHADAKQQLKLSKHLSPLVRIGLIQTWYDKEILPGAEFDQEIADKLAEADIVLLLISSDFVASEYCCEIELPAAMQRHENQEATVLPIIIRYTHGWQDLKPGKLRLGELNALPKFGIAIPKWAPQETGWADIAAGVERAAEAARKRMSEK
ncbi:MAG: COR domain-containing protein [Planctomycetaceae bacterium]